MMQKFVGKITDIEKRLDRLASTRQLYDIGNETTKAQFTANQDDYNPGDYDILRLSSDASRDLTGITGGVTGRSLLLVNTGTSDIILKHQSANSTAANRLLISSYADATLLPGQSAVAYYDSTTERWRVMYRPTVSITGIYGSYYLGANHRHYETIVEYNDYNPAVTSPSSPWNALNYTGAGNSRAIKMVDGKLYVHYRILSTWYIKQYDMVAKTSKTLSVTNANFSQTDWTASHNEIAYLGCVVNTLDADIAKIYIYKFDFAASSVTLEEQIPAYAWNGAYYDKLDAINIFVHVINNKRYLLMFGDRTLLDAGHAQQFIGLFFYKKDIDTGSASVITKTSPVSPPFTHVNNGLYQLYRNKIFVGSNSDNVDVQVWMITIGGTDTIVQYASGLPASTAVTQTEMSVDITSGKVHMVFSMTEAGPTFNKDVYEFDGATITRIARYAYTSPQNAIKLLQSKTHDYYLYISDTTTPSAGNLYDCVTQTLVSTISSSYSMIVYNVSSRIVDDNDKIWFHDNTSNKLYSWYIGDGTITTITCTITKASSSPKYHLTFVLGAYIAIVTVYSSSSTSSSFLWLVK